MPIEFISARVKIDVCEASFRIVGIWRWGGVGFSVVLFYSAHFPEGNERMH